MTEYILIVVLVAVAIVASVKLFGKDVKALWDRATNTVRSEAARVGR